MIPNGKQIRVFISSTFRDMYLEREELIKQIFPQIRKLCKQRGVSWSEVDLRWGITTEQAERNEILPICFKEIQRCNFFIGILGHIYGWIPDEIPPALIENEKWLENYGECSITELEILYGVLLNQERKHVFFYFRDLDASKKIEEQLKNTDYQRESQASLKKLELLKERIKRSNFPILKNYSTPQSLGKLVLHDLTNAINQLYPEDVKDDIDKEVFDHEAFAQHRARVYVGGNKYFRRIDENIQSNEGPLVIIGESGSGKSALLANWALKFRKQHPNDFLLIHFIGVSPYSTDWSVIARRILGELKRHFEIYEDIPDTSDELRLSLINWLYMAANKGRIVLILDALNQLEDQDDVLDIIWLLERIPANVRLIVSTLPGKILDAVKKSNWITLSIEPLDQYEREQFIKEYLELYGKSLLDSQIQKIISTDQTSNPLYLQTLLEELRLFGVYEEIEKRIKYYISAKTIDTLYERVLTRYEEDYEHYRPGLVRDTMIKLWAARRGLLESELLELLGSSGLPLPRAIWSPFYLAAENALINRSGFIGFFHDYLRQAIEKRYLPTEKTQKNAHICLANYFYQRELNTRKVEELPWQFLQASEFNALSEVLQDFSLVNAMFKHEKQDLLRYWSALEKTGQFSPVEVYSEALKNPEKMKEHLIWLVYLFDIVGDKKIILQLLKASEQIYRKTHDMEGLSWCLGLLAVGLFWESYEEKHSSSLPTPISMEQLDSHEAMRFLKEQEQICRNLNDERKLQECLGTQAQILIWSRQNWLALNILEQQKAICEKLKEKRGLARCLANMGFVQKILAKEDKALDLLKQAEKLCREVRDLVRLSGILDNIAHIYKELNRPYEMIYFLQEAALITEDIGYKQMLRNILGKLDQTYSYLGADIAALKLLYKQEEILKDLEDEKTRQICVKRRKNLELSISKTSTDAERPRMHTFPRYTDNDRRKGIIAVLQKISDENLHFLPKTDVLSDILIHISVFLSLDSFLAPESIADLETISKNIYRNHIECSHQILVPLRIALHKNKDMLEFASKDDSFRRVVQGISSELRYKVLPSKNFDDHEIKRLLEPFLKCCLLLFDLDK